MRYPEPINTVSLFPKIDAALIALLKSLDAADWDKRTASSYWTVKDVAAHLLDGALRRLSMHRDGYVPPDAPKGFSDHDDLVQYLNAINNDWVRVARRLSPRILIEDLERANGELHAFFETLNPKDKAFFPVAWAGETMSENWFDIARDYTEHWHHQQQIREAVGAPLQLEPELYYPVLDTFMRGLPHGYRMVPARSKETIAIHVTGETAGTWYLADDDSGWELFAEADYPPSTTVRIPHDIAWKVFTNRPDKTQLKDQIEVDGSPDKGLHILTMVAFMV
ncbi:MAG: maleylpyruvate isomerase N-terminal domain-containing protein [Candidatus Hydrogenedentes bacterium]|nr:maleylpyruvate isomerase N-terminal domain-containing protein [Candidatus Hydrogenedentota bacterium]